MRHFLLAVSAVMLDACATLPAETSMAEPERAEWSLAIHGGAGTIRPDRMVPGQEEAMNAALARALDAGAVILEAGGSALDAVEAATVVMEDDAFFNAGHGAVFTAEGAHELDASIMSGAARDAGAVAGVTRVRNPIKAARAVMEQSEHVMFAAEGADDFAASKGLELVDNSYFSTERRRNALERVLERRTRDDADRHGTVGAVALDMAGNLAAATSTGGMTAKARGRVGDSPLIGAATYAENGVCAVSATGHGEFFIRVGVAKAICARMELAGEDAETAAQIVLDEVAALGGDGGVIVMNASGEAALVFNSAGMYRGAASPAGRTTAIFAE